MTQVTGTSKAARKEYAPGDVVGGKYGLLRLLGEGGMGSVWVAENMALKANVALKLIRADVAEASANERFLSEARLAARLQHAAIVRVFDFGKTEHDEPFIVMELLEGETLGQRLARHGTIDAVELCQTLLPIIDALHSAHGHGVIHRDLKPDNVFVAKADGGGLQPKLLDFGIAKLRGESFHSTKLTQAGTLIGSPDYMSPEQARGETDLDPRSDVWALCVLAYECLVGKPPFHGDNYNALLWAIIHDEPVPVTVFQAGDAELWRILKRGFMKDRNARWESARKLGEALAAWLEGHGVVEDVCNRSLHASWLPAERPTRPELAPFDPLAAAPRGAVQAQLGGTAPTLAGLRRPHAMSLWFAGLGLLTLLGALLLSRSEDDGVPTVDAESGRQEVGTLLPGPAPETLADPAPARALEPAVAPGAPSANSPRASSPPGASPLRDSIGAAPLDRENGSWKENHRPPLRVSDLQVIDERDRRSVQRDGREVEAGEALEREARTSETSREREQPSQFSGGREQGEPRKAAEAARRASVEPRASVKPRASKASSARTASRAKPKPPRAATKKPAEPEPVNPLEAEIDFGI